MKLASELGAFKRQLGVRELTNACRELEQVECPVKHDFADGVYARTMQVPAGTFVIGKMHRFKTLNIMTKGRALVYVGDGIPAKEIVAPFTFTSDPMTSKMAFFVEDSEWVNVHPTDKTDLGEIEAEFIVPEEEFLDEEDIKCLG
jgi:hypothetical protein